MTVMSLAQCGGPFRCSSASGQCCLLLFTIRGPICPASCQATGQSLLILSPSFYSLFCSYGSCRGHLSHSTHIIHRQKERCRFLNSPAFSLVTVHCASGKDYMLQPSANKLQLAKFPDSSFAVKQAFLSGLWQQNAMNYTKNLSI